MIKAVIFDLDGVLIDSEPLWREAMVEIFNEIGVIMTPLLAQQSMGLRADESIRFWHHQSPWLKPSQKIVTQRLINRVIELILQKGEVMAGVNDAIDLIESIGLPMAIASSSNSSVIKAALLKLKIESKIQIICSAEHEKYGKPHPGVFITAAKKLGIPPEFCLVFEDSPNGLLAAKAAKMKCIAIPAKNMKDNKIYNIADKLLDSFLQLQKHDLEIS